MESRTHAMHPILELNDDITSELGVPAPVPLRLDQHSATATVTPMASEVFPLESEPETSQHRIRYERGSLIYATDGPVGTLWQIVVDEDMAEVKALVIRMAARNESLLVPPDLVDKSVGTALLLNVTKEQFALGAKRSPRMDTSMFTRARTKKIANIIPLMFAGDRQRSVVSLSGNRVETGDSLDVPPVAQPASAREPWWKRLRRA